MERALALAGQALARGHMPIGAVLARNGHVVGESYWRRHDERGFLGHPEHVVLVQADPVLDLRSRTEATLYTTLEPCLMCMGTAMSFFLGRVVYAMPAPPDGAANVAEAWSPTLGHPTAGGAYAVPVVEGGVCEADARALVAEWLRSGASGPEATYARQLLAPMR
jgi:tRNA(adenine34) deaminase